MGSYQMITPEETKQFLSSFADFIRQGVRFVTGAVRTNWLLILVVCMASGAYGYYQWRNKPVYFESEMVCAFNNLHKKTFGEMVNRLNTLTVTQSYAQLSVLLGITVKEAKKIVGFEAKNVLGSPLHEDLTLDKTPMYFTLKATTPDVFPSIQKGLLQYLNSTPYQETRDSLDKALILQKIAYLDSSVHKIDKVISAYASFLTHTSAITDSAAGFSNINMLFKYQEELVNEKIKETKQYHLLQSVEVIYGFAPAQQAYTTNNHQITKTLLLGFALAIFLAVARKLFSYA